MNKTFFYLLLKEIDKRFIQEYRFDRKRKWRFDYAIPELKIGVEYDGGMYIQGRHNRAIGYTKDCEKLNQAALRGWLVLRYTPLMDNGQYGEFFEIVKKAIRVQARRFKV